MSNPGTKVEADSSTDASFAKICRWLKSKGYTGHTNRKGHSCLRDAKTRKLIKKL